MTVLAWNPLSAAERQLLTIDREILGMERELRNLGATGAVSAEHAVRRAELAQRIRAQLEWLRPKRAEMRAELAALEADQ